MTETNIYTSIFTRKTFEINHRFDCNDKCQVYLMTFIKCKKQYACETTNHFRRGWNNHKSMSRSFDRGEQCTQENLCRHFECHSDFCDYVSVILIVRLIAPTLLKEKHIGCKP